MVRKVCLLAGIMCMHQTELFLFCDPVHLRAPQLDLCRKKKKNMRLLTQQPGAVTIAQRTSADPNINADITQCAQMPVHACGK